MTNGIQWIKTSDELPKKPGIANYEYVDCVIFVNGEIKFRPWNCEHLCWDDEHYDDFAFEATKPTHWAKINRPPETLT